MTHFIGLFVYAPDAHIEEMKKESETEATCKVCGQVTTLNMLKNGVHYTANLCQMFRR